MGDGFIFPIGMILSNIKQRVIPKVLVAGINIPTDLQVLRFMEEILHRLIGDPCFAGGLSKSLVVQDPAAAESSPDSW